MTRMGQPAIAASAMPRIPDAPKAIQAASFTVAGAIRPLWVTRGGPTRFASAPCLKSE